MRSDIRTRLWIALALVLAILCVSPWFARAQSVPSCSGVSLLGYCFKVTTPTPTPTPTATPTATPTPTPILTASPTPSPTPTFTPTPSPTPVPTATATPTAVPGPTLSPQAFGVNTSATEAARTYDAPTTSAVSTNVLSADTLADSVAYVNAPTCANTTIFGSTPVASDLLGLEYLKLPGEFRGVRDGEYVCYNTANRDTWWATAYKYEHLTMLAGFYNYIPLSIIQGIQGVYPMVSGLEFANEIDAYTGDSNSSIKLSTASVAGATTLNLGSQVAAKTMFRGMQYTIADSSNPETFTVSTNQTDPTVMNVIGTGTGGTLLYAHAANTAVNRVATDFVPETLAWYQNESPLIRTYQPQMPIYGPSMAFGIHAYSFVTDGVTLGQYLDAEENHAYMAGQNPEGADGSWYKGYTGINHPPCSYANTSYSQWFDGPCAGREASGAGYENLPTVSTEQSNSTFAYGATSVSSGALPNGVPDDVGLDYLLRNAAGQLAHGFRKTFWFQLWDGTDGPTSGFCEYGLIRVVGATTCNSNYAATLPKPEFMGLLSFIAHYDDSGCPASTCQFAVESLNGSWNNTALPFNTSNARFSNGEYSILFWMGTSLYTPGTTGSCRPSSCYVAPVTASKTFTSPLLAGLSSVSLVVWDDTPTDPLPPSQNILAADGTTQTVVVCPAVPTTNYFGCVEPAQTVAVSGTSVTITANQAMEAIEFTPTSVGTPMPIPVPTITPIATSVTPAATALPYATTSPTATP